MAQGTLRACDVGLGRPGIRGLGTPRRQQADNRGLPAQLQGGRHSVPEQKQAQVSAKTGQDSAHLSERKQTFTHSYTLFLCIWCPH